MRCRQLILSACIACLAVASTQAGAADSKSALPLLESCITHLRDKEHLSRPDQSVTLRESCPALYRQVGHQALQQLDPPLKNQTTFGQLSDSQRALASIYIKTKSVRRLNTDGLENLLKQIFQDKKPIAHKKGLIDRFMDWLERKYNEIFKKDNWFTRNFDFGKNMDKSVKQGIVNTLVVILVLLVVFIIANELRAANFLALFRSRKQPRMNRPGQTIKTARSLSSLDDVANLPLYRQVPALLRYTLQQLMDRQILPRRHNLTNREFLEIVRRRLPGAGREFEALVHQTELLVYGNRSMAAGETSRYYELVRNIEQAQDKQDT